MNIVERVLTESDLETFRTDGSVILRGLLDDFWMETLRLGYEEAVIATSAGCKSIKQYGTGSFMMEGCSRQCPSIATFLRESPTAAAAAAAMGAKEVRLYEDLLLVRERGGDPSVWHQDTSHWPVVGTQLCSIWVSLDEAKLETGAMSMVVGSHRGPLYTPGSTIPHSLRHLIEQEEGGELPDFDAMPERFPVKTYETSTGDVVLFHPTALHSAAGASNTVSRKTFTFRFVGENVRWRWRGISLHDRLRATKLRDGDPLEDQAFPLVWPLDRCEL